MTRKLRGWRWTAVAAFTSGFGEGRACGMDSVLLPNGPSATATFEGEAGARWRTGLVPPFQSSTRTRSELALGLGYAPAPAVSLDAAWSWIWDHSPSGQRASGPGDLSLGTWARVASPGGPERSAVRIGWRASLPNASDADGLGSDETDVAALASAGAMLGPAWLALTGGVAILGDPLRFAAQDDGALLWLHGAAPLGPVGLRASVGGAFATAANPARLRATLGVEGRCPWLYHASVEAGLTPAAADLGLALGIGWGTSCPAGRGD